MNVLAQFQTINDNDKASVVRKLMQSSTPDFDFFYLVGLSVLMATLGLISDSAAIVIGSMLLAPLMYPILGIALGLVMSNGEVLNRSFWTLSKSFAIGLSLAVFAAFLFGDAASFTTHEVLIRTEPSLLHFLVAFIAGLAVSFALAQPQWSETLPGIAISVALIPPLAAIGVGIAALDMEIVTGSVVLLTINLLGIVFAAMISFSLMNLYQKQNIAASTIKKENERLEEEKKVIEQNKLEQSKNSNQETKI
ncbi:MAG: putative hydrophobic protein (TIGR00271 family) [Candidatus Azotimanducaceae bacterium]|jgi:uncharacterized hydrophobic protein (TIGR00271 family)